MKEKGGRRLYTQEVMREMRCISSQCRRKGFGNSVHLTATSTMVEVSERQKSLQQEKQGYKVVLHEPEETTIYPHW